jgi:hypothetical protein
MQLVSEYGELLLLHRIGYRGEYVPRSNTTLLNSIPVPSAVPPPSTS